MITLNVVTACHAMMPALMREHTPEVMSLVGREWPKHVTISTTNDEHLIMTVCKDHAVYMFFFGPDPTKTGDYKFLFGERRVFKGMEMDTAEFGR